MIPTLSTVLLDATRSRRFPEFDLEIVLDTLLEIVLDALRDMLRDMFLDILREIFLDIGRDASLDRWVLELYPEPLRGVPGTEGSRVL